jgi:hypothetical protein
VAEIGLFSVGNRPFAGVADAASIPVGVVSLAAAAFVCKCVFLNVRAVSPEGMPVS